ncbi:MAG: ATP-binding protein [Halosimplex sp.]
MDSPTVLAVCVPETDAERLATALGAEFRPTEPPDGIDEGFGGDETTETDETDAGTEVESSGDASADETGRPTVRALADRGELFDELCRSTVHCVVLPADVRGTPAVKIARGVTAMYPDLPVVLSGVPARVVPEDLEVTVVEAANPDDPAVADAVRTVLSEGTDSHAARPPSRTETLFLSMFDGFPVHLYAKDEAGRHVLTSRHSDEPTHLTGLTDLEYVALPLEHRKAAYRDDMRVVEDEEEILAVEEYTDYVDSHTLTSKVPWYDADGDVVGLVGLTRDITERKQRESATRRQQELLVKLAVLSAHEFRNELQVALGRLELVEDDPSQIEVIRDSHERLIDIVDKVVELASHERGARREKTVWLSTLAREVWDTLGTDEATLSIERDARAVVDPESLSLFLQLLFDNAVQHAGPAVSVAVGATDDGFYVADDGPGIDADPPDRVFDAGYSTDPDSTGFGLFVARSIAHEHNWSLSISESDEGGSDERGESEARESDGSPGARFDVSGLSLER